MFIGLSFLFIFLVIIIMIIIASRRMNNGYNSFDDADEEVVHTTTTTTTTVHDEPLRGWTDAECASDFGRNTAGTITRGWQDNKPYVIDPVDGTTMQLAETDDLYEDAAGKMWNLI